MNLTEWNLPLMNEIRSWGTLYSDLPSLSWHLMRRRKALALLSNLTSVGINYGNSSLSTYLEAENKKRANNYRIIREHKLKFYAQIEKRSWKDILSTNTDYKPWWQNKTISGIPLSKIQSVGPSLGHGRKNRARILHMLPGKHRKVDNFSTVLKLEFV